ncbi:PTS sugar transporter subunit IIA [Haloferula sargassicola]|uniref:PTS EIIA type-2 domain-containing protein n=1 Tax=Haloferula sargassicola TaxID=490096 RepID=A0ABP9UKI2_9BACT
MLIGALSPTLPVLLDLEAGSEEEAIRSVAGLLADHPHVLEPERFVEAVLERQRLQPPLLGAGVALPHARCDSVREIVMAAGRLRDPVRFGDTPVKLIFVIGVPRHCVADYLAMTSALARRLRDVRRREALLEAGDVEAFRCELSMP